MFNEERKRDKSKKDIDKIYKKREQIKEERDEKSIYTFSKSKSKSKSKEREKETELKQSDCRKVRSKQN